MSLDDFCIICRKTGKTFDNRICPFCNGTGEPTNTAEEYMRNHICQCIILDRVFCPICEKKCHHDTTLNPKQTIESGGDSAAPTKRNKSHESLNLPSNERLVMP